MNPPRLILITGKGGSGKSSIAAATALHCAALGHRTLVAAVDGGGGLDAALDQALGPEPVALAAGSAAGRAAWGCAIDSRHEALTRWGAIPNWLGEVMRSLGIDLPAADLALLPGIEGVIALLGLLPLADSGRWDVIIVDCPAATELLRLLAWPSWAGGSAALTGRLPSGDSLAARLARPLVQRLIDVPLPDEHVGAATRALGAAIARLNRLLGDPDVTSVRVVLTPERLSARDARRTVTALGLFGYPVDAVLRNRVKRVAGADTAAGASYGRWPMLDAPLLPEEPIGHTSLTELGGSLYRATDPTAVLSRHPTLASYAEGDGRLLVLPLALVEPEDIGLTQIADQLTIRVLGLQRTMTLPESLRGMKCGNARLEGGLLTLRFVSTAGDDL